MSCHFETEFLLVFTHVLPAKEYAHGLQKVNKKEKKNLWQ
jgi:hypothetical protein